MPLPGALPLIGAGVSALTGYLTKRNENRGLESDRRYVDETRNMAGGLAQGVLNNPGSYFLGPDQRSVGEQASQFFNPYQSHVIDALGEQYDTLRSRAGMNENAGATLAGAFGGDRHQLQLGARMGELDAAQMGQVANLLHGGYQSAVTQGLQYSEYQRALRERQAQEPIYRAQTALGLRGQGMGPTGLPGGGSAMASGLSAGLATFNALKQPPLPSRPPPVPQLRVPGFG